MLFYYYIIINTKTKFVVVGWQWLPIYYEVLEFEGKFNTLLPLA